MKKSAFRRVSQQSLEKQFGTKDSWRFRSITTPGKSFPLAKALAEFVILQRYGKDVPPLFWYKKTGCKQMRSDFIAIENKIAAMIYRKEHITALQLLSIVCEKFPPLPRIKIQPAKKSKKEKLAKKPLITFKHVQVDESLRSEIARISDGKEKKE